MELSTYLLLPIFWKSTKIARFWCELSEILNQARSNKPKPRTLEQTLSDLIKDFDSQENLKLVCNGDLDWMKKLATGTGISTNPIKDYIDLRNKYADAKNQDNYNHSRLTDLLRLYRNLSTHKYGNYVHNIAQFTPTERIRYKNLYAEVKGIFKDGGVTYMLDRFPELLLLSYSFGYKVSKCLHTFKIPSDFGETFYPGIKFDLVANASTTDPVFPESLVDFSSGFSKEITNQQKSATERWSHLVEFTNGPTIQFFRNLEQDSVLLGQREIMNLRWILKNDKINSIEIARDKVSYQEEADCISNRICSKQSEVKTISLAVNQPITSLNFMNYHLMNPPAGTKSSTDKRQLVIMFSDILSVALSRALRSSKNTHFVIFTHVLHQNIEAQIQASSIILNTKYNAHCLSWNELNKSYRDKILQQDVNIQKNSKVRINLKDVHKKNSNLVTELKGYKLIDLMQLTTPYLMETGMLSLKHYISRLILDHKSRKKCQDDELVTLLKKSVKNDLVQKTIFIFGIAGIGKSTLLIEIGHKLVNSGQLVKLFSAIDLFQTISESAQINDLSSLLKTHCTEYETCILTYLLQNNTTNLIFTILIDGLDELNSVDDQQTLINLIKRVKASLNNLNVSFVITSKPSVKSTFENLDIRQFCKQSHKFTIQGFLSPDKEEYLKKRWENLACNGKETCLDCKNKIRLCITDSLKLGDFGGTPTAMELYAKMYRGNQKFSSMSVYQIYKKFTHLLLEIEFLKGLQNQSLPFWQNITNENVNLSCTELKISKKFHSSINARNAFATMFPEENDLLGCFDLSMYLSTSKLFHIRHGKLETSGLVHGSLKEFYVALFICDLIKTQSDRSEIFFKRNRISEFFVKKLLTVDQSGCLQYGNVICLVNSILEKWKFVFNTKLLVPEDFDTVLLNFVRQKYNYLFVSLLGPIQPERTGIASCWNDIIIDDLQNPLYDIFHYAIGQNSVSAVKYCVNAIGLHVNELHYETEQTALHCALKSPSYDIIKFLLQNKADMAELNMDDLSAFEIACSKNMDSSIFRLFAEYGKKEQFRDNAQKWKLAIENGVHTEKQVFDGLFKTEASDLQTDN